MDTMISWLKKNFSLVLSLGSGAVLIFLAGVTAGHLELPPQPFVSEAIEAVRDLKKNAQSYFANKPTKFLRPLRYKKTGLVVFQPEHAQPGVTFLLGLFGNTLGVRLYALNGTLIHEWPIDFFQLAPEEMRFPFDAFVHGAALYPNGDFVANFEKHGMVRVSACGKVLWGNHSRTHHAIFIDEEGFIWAPRRADRYYVEKSIWHMPFKFDQVGRFDPESGEMVAEIDLVRVVVEAGAQGLIVHKSNPEDIMHLNDVDVLSASMADRFPLFEAGDIMLSSKNFNQIWILDGETHALKWWQTGPMDSQHDPDFQPDGTITLFDNRPSGLARPENGFLGDGGGSRILRIDPQSRAYETVYATNEKNTFYSPARGKHQMLANGNLLIAETDAGRALEIMPDGEIVWSFVNAWDEDEVAWIIDAIRYPSSYARIGDIECPAH